jgi:pSer/pThr/pTyr-binding forkhead associated (FHA) protein
VPSVASAQPTGSQIICPTCGSQVQAGHKFCGSCGSPMPALGAGVPQPASQQPSGANPGRSTMFVGAMQAARAKLVLMKGDGLDGISFTLAGQDHVAGRGNDCPLLFREDPFLSPVHANFLYKEGKLHVRDEKSANGVFIRIRAPMPLRSGDTFLVGEQVLRVETTLPETAGLGPDDGGTFFYASPRRASKMRLVQLLRGGDTGLIYRAAGDIVTLGRDGNDINFPEDPFISGRHAQVAFGGAGLMLTDTGSKNGTFLRINVESPLHHGDYVFMGQQLLRVEIV